MDFFGEATYENEAAPQDDDFFGEMQDQEQQQTSQDQDHFGNNESLEQSQDNSQQIDQPLMDQGLMGMYGNQGAMLDPEEISRQHKLKEVEQKQQERIYEQQQEEEKQKEELQSNAQSYLQKLQEQTFSFLTHLQTRERIKRIQNKKKENRENQNEIKKENLTQSESYETIINNIETNPNEYKGSLNVDRMKNTILSRKHDLGKQKE